ncbi:MAG: alpha/beta hydrolase [Candidatus Aenigmarchaeota archaeon]|nr:alpha/beta hydrolase [Candidatus Aenigmarchaeota archaeon]
MKGKIQLLYVHGGETFKNRHDYLKNLRTREIKIEARRRWHGEYFDKTLGKKFQIIRPRMPLSDNAIYNEWKIHFERHFPKLKSNVILVGNSLGGIFLAKYLSENKPKKKILSTYLVCPPFYGKSVPKAAASGFALKKDLTAMQKHTKNLCLMFSKDDDVVPVEHAEKYRNALKQPRIIIYKSKNGHFRIEKFPELVRMIKADVKL